MEPKPACKISAAVIAELKEFAQMTARYPMSVGALALWHARRLRVLILSRDVTTITPLKNMINITSSTKRAKEIENTKTKEVT